MTGTNRILLRPAPIRAAAWLLAVLAASGSPSLRLDRGDLGPNLLANPSAEAGESGRPAGWTFEGEGLGTWDRGTASRGERSLGIAGAGAWRSSPFPLDPGRVVLLAADTRLSGYGRWGTILRLDFLDADGGRVGKIETYLQDEHSWWRLRAAGVSPPGTVAAAAACGTVEDVGLRSWCDGVEVRAWTADREPPPPDAGGGGVWRFDFGTATSAVQPGYAAVDPTTRYARSRGHGWVSSVRLAGRDQTHGAYRPAESDERARGDRTLLDPLTRDYVAGVGAARFQVDLPAGRYRVFVLAGHSRFDESPAYFDLDVAIGGERAGTLSKRWPGVSFDWDEFAAAAGEAGLAIGFSSERFGGAWAVAALLIYDEASAAGRRDAEEIVRSLEELPADLRPRLRRLPGAWTPPAAEPTPGGLQVFRGDASELRPQSDRWTARASPGLSADFRFAIQVEAPAVDLEIDVERFRAAGGGELDARRDLWHVRDRALRRNQGYVEHELYSVEPDQLTPRLPRRLDPGRAHPFWLRVRLPDGAPAGLFRSRLRIGRAGSAPVEVPLELEVLPFGAAEPALFQNVYYRGAAGTPAREPVIGVEEEAAALRAAGVADIADHLGSAAVSVDRLPVYARPGGGYGVELAFLRERIEDHRRAGRLGDALVLLQPVLQQIVRLTAPGQEARLGKHVSALPDLPEAAWEALGDVVKAVDDELAANGVQRRIYNPWDEAFGDDLVVFARVARVLRERLPEPRILCNVTVRNYLGGAGVPADRALGPHCNVWWVYGTLTDAQRERELARGTWLMGRFEAEDPAIARAAAGLQRWRRAEMGGSWWAYDAINGSATTQLDGRSWGDRCLVYPTHPPSPRLAWESTRLGHEDLRYLTTLERRVAESERDPRPAVRHAARRGAALLERLRARLDPTIPEPLGSPAAYDEVRDELIDALLRLDAARGGGPDRP